MKKKLWKNEKNKKNLIDVESIKSLNCPICGQKLDVVYVDSEIHYVCRNKKCQKNNLIL